MKNSDSVSFENDVLSLPPLRITMNDDDDERGEEE
jgi:hypothetical protein